MEAEELSLGQRSNLVITLRNLLKNRFALFKEIKLYESDEQLFSLIVKEEVKKLQEKLGLKKDGKWNKKLHNSAQKFLKEKINTEWKEKEPQARIDIIKKIISEVETRIKNKTVSAEEKVKQESFLKELKILELKEKKNSL